MGIIWVVLLGVLVYFVLRGDQHGLSWKTGDGHETALDVLKRRYARGEVSKEEFEEKKRDLQ